MAWVSLDTVFDENSREYATLEYNKEWGPYADLIARRDAELRNFRKYGRERNNEIEMGM